MKHESMIHQSFDPRAKSYLASPIHSQGADLKRLASLVAPTRPSEVLDLGCGAGHASFALAPVAQEVVAYDLSESMLAVVASTATERGLLNIRTQQGSVERLPFPPGRFDWVVSRFSAHHWRDVPKALAETRRVLKPGGHVCFIDAAGGPEPLFDTHLQALELLRDPSHVRDYTEGEWLALIHSASLKATVVERRRIPIEFSSWVERIATEPPRVEALKSLWAGAPAEVREYFQLKDDFSFEIDGLMVHATGAD